MSWTYDGRCVGVADARTLTVRLKFPPTGVSCDVPVVLEGVDVPELVGPEATLGQASLAALRALVDGKDIQVTLEAPTAPGRCPRGTVLLMHANARPGEPWCTDVSSELMRLGHARPESPGARAPWVSQPGPSAE